MSIVRSKQTFLTTLLLLVVTAISGCAAHHSRAPYTSALSLAKQHPALYREIKKEFLALQRNTPSDPGTYFGEKLLALRTDKGAAFPRIVELDESGTEQNTLVNLNEILGWNQTISLRALSLNPDLTKIALTLSDRSSTPILLISDLETNEQSVFEVPGLGEVQWGNEATLLFTVLNQGLARSVHHLSCQKICSPPSLLWNEQDPAAQLSLITHPKGKTALIRSDRYSRNDLYHLSLESLEITKLVSTPPDLKDAVTPFRNGFAVGISSTRGKWYSNGAVQNFSIPSGHLESLHGVGDSLLASTRSGLKRVILSSSDLSSWSKLTLPYPSCFPRVAPNQQPSHHSVRIWCDSFSQASTAHDIPVSGSQPPDTQSPAPSMESSFTQLADRVSFATLQEPNKQIVAEILIAYGAYGHTLLPRYDPLVSLLLRHGFRVHFAYIRGGGLYRHKWHQEATGAKKSRSINDLRQITEYLKRNSPTLPLFLLGRSAGATVVTALASTSPELLSGVVIDSPLLDVRRAVSDPTLPLLPREVLEWGDPTSPTISAALRTYSPVELTLDQQLPPFFVRIGNRDKLTPPEDVARWISETAEHQSDIVVRSVPGGSHQGASSEHDQLHEDSLLAIFLLRNASG